MIDSKLRSVIRRALQWLLLGAVLMSPATYAEFIRVEKACDPPSFCVSPVDVVLTDLSTGLVQQISDLAVFETRTIPLPIGNYRLTELVPLIPPDAMLVDISVSGISAFTVDLANRSVDFTLAADDEARIVFTNAAAVPEPGTLGLLTLAVAGVYGARGRRRRNQR